MIDILSRSSVANLITYIPKLCLVVHPPPVTPLAHSSMQVINNPM